MFSFNFIDDMREAIHWIIFPVTLPPIFLKLVVLLNMSQPVCKADRQNSHSSEPELKLSRFCTEIKYGWQSIIGLLLTWLSYQLSTQFPQDPYRPIAIHRQL
jgi:hypothetical protein